MKMRSLICLPFVVCMLAACSQKESSYNDSAESKEVSNSYDSTSPSTLMADTIRQFIKTADLQLKVKSVLASSKLIEENVIKAGGFVLNSEISDGNGYSSTVLVKPDSSLETTRVSMSGNISLRVPDEQLDVFLQTVASFAIHVKSKTVKAEDVSLNLISDKLSVKRARNHGKRVEKAIEQKGRKLNDVMQAEQDLASGEEQSDLAQINTLQLNDQISYSTVTLQLNESPSVITEMIFTPESKIAYEPPFGLKLKSALIDGWKILEAILIFLVSIWGIWLLAIAGLLIYRRLDLLKRINKSI